MSQEVKLDEIPLGELEWVPNAGQYFAEALKEAGAEVAFGILGGDLFVVTDAMSRAGIKLVTFHHEQSAVYAAEGYSRATGKVGLCYADTGPGTANMASALQQAYLSNAPIVLITGGTIDGHQEAFTIQPSDAKALYGHLAKWVVRITNPAYIKRFVLKAFKDAQEYPKGIVILEFPLYEFNGPLPSPRLIDLLPHMMYVPQWRGENTDKPLPQPAGDPAAVERAVKLLYEAKSPLVYAGDGAHWSQAGPELVELVELAQVPAAGRRVGRGAIPEDHPLFVSHRIHGELTPLSDLMILFGVKVGAFDSMFGMGWPRCIQISESPRHIFTFLNTPEAIVGSPKQVARQMIDYIKANNLKPPPDRAEWVKKVQEMHRNSRQRLMERAEKYRDHKPVHHGYMAKVLWEIMEERYQGKNRAILDGFTISSFTTPFIQARYSGQIMDAGEQAGVGHSVGMAIGAALGDPETKKRPIVALLGDAGFGLTGIDCETAARLQLPIVYLVSNNQGWMPAIRYITYGPNWEALGPQDQGVGQAFLPGIRYDKMGEALFCHGEHVEEPSQIRPALERAFKSAEEGKPAVVNVMVDPTLTNLGAISMAYAVLFGHVPYRDLTKYGKAMRRSFLGFAFPGFEKYGIPDAPWPDGWEPIPSEMWER